MSHVVTGEAVALDLRVAQLGSRLVAALIDIAIEIGLLLALIFLVAFIQPDLDPQLAQAFFVVVLLAFGVGYPVAFETLWRGQTPGKAALGLRVVRDDGGPLRFRHALGRALVGFAVERPGVTGGSAAVISSLLSTRGKRLGDFVAGTMVIQERVPAHRVQLVQMPPQLAAWASTLDLSRLPDDLALAARDFLGRAGQLHPTARETLGRQIAEAMAAVVSPPAPDGTPGWAFLSAVLAERRRREEARLGVTARPVAAGWAPPPPSPAWGPSPTGSWGASAPPTGVPTTYPGPPPYGSPPPVPPPTAVPPPAPPEHGPAPTPPTTPPPPGDFAPPG